jgi:hypothetical protein
MPIVKIAKCLNCNIGHEWFFDGLDLREMRLIKKLTGMRGKEFGEAGDAGDPDAIAALLVILHKRGGITLSYDDANLDLTDFDMQPTDDEAAAMAKAEKQAAPDDALSPKAANGRKAKVA